MDIKTLDMQIKKDEIKNLYLFYGEEKFLMENKLKSIKKRCVAEGFEEFNYFVFDGNNMSEWEAANAVSAYPQMSESKLVVFRNTGIFSGEGLKEFCLSIIENIPEYTCVIFIEKEIDKRKKKLVEAFKEKGEMIEFAPLSLNHAQMWIERMIDKQGKKISNADIFYMVTICGTDMENLNNQLEKLLGYVGEREKITREDVDSVVSKSIEVRVFDILDNITSGGKAQKIFEDMAKMKISKEQPTVLLSLLTAHLSDMLMVKLLQGQGVTLKEIKKYFEPNRQFLAEKFLRMGNRMDIRFLKRMTDKGLEYDYAIKTGRLDGWTAAEMYMAELITPQ